MLMKLTPGVNFTNILRAAFSYKSFLCSFYVLTIWVCNFWRKDLGTKAVHKMLVKLTPGGRNCRLIYAHSKVKSFTVETGEAMMTRLKEFFLEPIL
jgi:hypothetical protein